MTAQGRDHVVLEQVRIAESWRSRRWDSLRLIAPNWSLELPGYSYAGDDPDVYMGKDEVVDNFVAYARSFAAPVEEGVQGIAIERGSTPAGFRVVTEVGAYAANARHWRSAEAARAGSGGRPTCRHRPGCAVRLPESWPIAAGRGVGRRKWPDK